MKNVQVTLDVDVEGIAKKLLEGSDEGGWGLQQQVEDEVRRQVVSQVAASIHKAADIQALFEGWGQRYLTAKAKQLLDETLRKHTQEHVDRWIKTNLEFLVGNEMRKEFEKQLLPRMQKLVSSLVVVNEESVNEQLEDLQSYAESVEQEANEARQ